MQPAATIDEVLERLDGIVAQARQRGTADGYFAALYRRVTAEVKVRIGRDEFVKVGWVVLGSDAWWAT